MLDSAGVTLAGEADGDARLNQDFITSLYRKFASDLPSSRAEKSL